MVFENKAYLLVYGDTLGTREEIKSWVDELGCIWRYDLPNCFYLVSKLDARTLAEGLQSKAGGGGTFIISEIGDNKWGWLPSESWHLIFNKEVLREPDVEAHDG